VRVLETLPINILRRSAGLPNEVVLIFKCNFDLSLSVEIKQSVIQLVRHDIFDPLHNYR